MVWPHDAYVGQEMVVIHAGYPAKNGGFPWWTRIIGFGRYYLPVGKTTKIRSIGKYKEKDTVMFRVTVGRPETWYSSACFRPVQTTKSKRTTDKGMSILHSLLNAKPVRKPERERA